MATKTNNENERVRAAEIVEETPSNRAGKGEKADDEAESQTQEVLLAPRYLVPSFGADDSEDTERPSAKRLLYLAGGILLLILLGLYIYGATLA